MSVTCMVCVCVCKKAGGLAIRERETVSTTYRDFRRKSVRNQFGWRVGPAEKLGWTGFGLRPQPAPGSVGG